MAVQRWRFGLRAAFLAATGLGSGAAHAGVAPAGVINADDHAGLAEVVVTAQRTTSVASKTPLALSVLAGEQLARAGIENPAALGARLPNVHLDGAADGLRITIRGVSNNDTTSKGDPSAAFLQDGIYIARPQAQDMAFLDVARIEVLRGPQGTLYGRNATAGVVNVISQLPGREREATLSVGAGNYGRRTVQAMFNEPVNHALALRAAIAHQRHDSYLRNGQGTGYALGLDRDDLAARLSASLALGSTATLLLRADTAHQHHNPDAIVPVTNFYAIGADGTPRWIRAGADARLTNAFRPANAPLEQGAGKARSSGASAQLDWMLGPASLHYLAARRSFRNDFHTNYYYQLAPAFALGVRSAFSGHYEQDSHELRVATGTGPLTAQAGLYYLREQSDAVTSFRDLGPLGLPPYYVFPQGPTVATAKAVFGQATYQLAPRLRATAGARYSDDDKARLGSTNFQRGPVFNPATDLRLLNAAAVSSHKTTWRFGGEFDLAPRAMAFATVSTGYKAGGFNDGCLAGSSYDGIACPAALAVPESTLLYQPETLTSMEAGIKARLRGGRAAIAATVFHYDYENLQVSGVAMVQNVPRFVTNNAAQARVRGLEVEAESHLTPRDRVSATFTLLDARYRRYLPDGATSWQGRRLDRSPRATLTLGVDHTFALEGARLKAGAFARYSAPYVISVPSQLLQYTVPSGTQGDLTLGYLPNRSSWSLHGIVRNVENRIHPVAIDSFGMVVPSAPRTVGVRLDYRY
jgi:iron complex outermembrane receptor protein